MEHIDNTIKDFLNTCNILVSDLSQLNNMLIPREILLDNNTYIKAKNTIPKLKNIFSSSSLTALQENAYNTQKWPLLNLVRQVLKSYNYALEPKRISNGYSKEGKKRYKRYFIIKKLENGP